MIAKIQFYELQRIGWLQHCRNGHLFDLTHVNTNAITSVGRQCRPTFVISCYMFLRLEHINVYSLNQFDLFAKLKNPRIQLCIKEILDEKPMGERMDVPILVINTINNHT